MQQNTNCMQCFPFSCLVTRFQCSYHTGTPQFRHANLVLFWCTGRQIWQRFHAVSGSWTCAGIADVNSGNMWMVDNLTGGNSGITRWRAQCPGRRKVPTMSQVLFFNTVCCSQKTLSSNMWCQTSFLPRTPSNLGTTLVGKTLLLQKRDQINCQFLLKQPPFQGVLRFVLFIQNIRMNNSF